MPASARTFIVLLAAFLAIGCRDSLAPTITMQVRGTVRIEEAPLSNARVVLRDQRTESEQGYILGFSNTDAQGRYQLTALADRPGYGLSCDNMYLYVEGYRAITSLSVPLRCTNEVQDIDLTIAELAAQTSR